MNKSEAITNREKVTTGWTSSEVQCENVSLM